LPEKPEIAALLTLTHNQSLNLDSASFTDPAKFDFRPKEGSALSDWAGKKWLEQHPGLQLDEFRKSLPELEMAGRFEMPKPRQMFDSEKDLKRSNEMSNP
jgi:hypothetical protein